MIFLYITQQNITWNIYEEPIGGESMWAFPVTEEEMDNFELVRNPEEFFSFNGVPIPPPRNRT